MQRRILTAVMVIGLLATVNADPAAASGGKRPTIDRVLIISLPGVGWRDLARRDLPNLRRLLDGAAVADLSTRAPKLRADLAGNYASLSAGDKAVGASTAVDGNGIAPAGAAYTVSEPVGNQTAGEVFLRRTGRDPGPGLVVLGVQQIVAANAATQFRASVGALGDALADAGWTRSVIANGDGSEGADVANQPRRAAASALMDSDGTVPAGELGSRLLVADAAAPFGVRLELNAVEMTFAQSWTSKSVVMVEASDLVRTDHYRGLVGLRRARELRSDALANTDALVGRLMVHVNPGRDAVVVVGTAPNPLDGRLAAVAVRAPGVPEGLLRSGTTQRTGFVQLMDVAPSVLDLVGVDVPHTMRGRPVAVGARSHDSAARERFLVDADNAAAFRDVILEPVGSVFFALVVVLLVVAGLGWFRPRSAWPAVASWWALVTLAFIPAVYLARTVPFHTIGIGAYWAWIGVGSFVLAAAARFVGRRHVLDPLIALLAVTVGVLGVDVMMGSPLQFNGALGFSPEVAGRFIGFGNAGFSAFSAAALFLACLVAVRVPRGGRLAALAILAGAVVLDGAPFWGADVGGVLSLVPAFGLVAVRLTGWRIRLRTVGFVVAVTGLAIAAASVIDLSRPPGSRTHLGRLMEQLSREGPGELVDVVTRKLGMNLASWSSSPFRWLVPIVILGFVGLWLLPDQRGRTAWRTLDPTGALAVGFVALVVLGYGLNDTGVLVPALMGAIALAVLVPVLLVPLMGDESVAEYRRVPAGGARHAVRQWSHRS